MFMLATMRFQRRLLRVPKVEVTVTLTPDEFRETLPEELRDLFDKLASSLVEGSAMSVEEAKGLVAQMLLDALKKEASSD